MAALAEDNSIRATCRMTGTAKGTVIKLLVSLWDEGDVDQNHQNIYLFLLSQEVGFDGGRLRYLGMGASAISTAILKEEREENI